MKAELKKFLDYHTEGRNVQYTITDMMNSKFQVRMFSRLGPTSMSACLVVNGSDFSELEKMINVVELVG